MIWHWFKVRLWFKWVIYFIWLIIMIIFNQVQKSDINVESLLKLIKWLLSENLRYDSGMYRHLISENLWKLQNGVGDAAQSMGFLIKHSSSYPSRSSGRKFCSSQGGKNMSPAGAHQIKICQQIVGLMSERNILDEMIGWWLEALGARKKGKRRFLTQAHLKKRTKTRRKMDTSNAIRVITVIALTKKLEGFPPPTSNLSWLIDTSPSGWLQCLFRWQSEGNHIDYV